MAYSGMPSHYPHWSYGKSYEKLKTLYDHGVSGLPYEMVINSNPALAYLMRDNSLLPADPDHRARLRPQRLLQEQLHLPARPAPSSRSAPSRRTRERVRALRRGSRASASSRSRRILDAAHALSLQCRRNLAVQEALARGGARAARSTPRSRRPIRSSSIHRRAGVRTSPICASVRRSSPEEDLLLFIRDHNPYLADWEQDLLTIVARGGAVLHPADRDQDHERGLGLVLAQAHPRRARAAAGAAPRVPRPPQPGGAPDSRAASTRTTSASSIWEDIERRGDDPTPEERERIGPPARPARDLLFEIREVDRDVSFLRRWLTERAHARARPLPSTSRAATTWSISDVSDEDGWRDGQGARCSRASAWAASR